MDVDILRSSKGELEAQLAATCKRFEESTGATIVAVKISPFQDYERIDDNEISIKKKRWFSVKVAIEI